MFPFRFESTVNERLRGVHHRLLELVVVEAEYVDCFVVADYQLTAPILRHRLLLFAEKAGYFLCRLGHLLHLERFLAHAI